MKKTIISLGFLAMSLIVISSGFNVALASTPTPTPSNSPSPTITPTPTPFITVLSPNGGEVLKVGNSYEIKWNSNLGIKGVEIYLERKLTSDTQYWNIGKINGGTHDVSPSSGSFTWKIPSSILWGGVPNEIVSDASYKIQIAETGAKGTEIVARSNAFSIASTHFVSDTNVCFKFERNFGVGNSLSKIESAALQNILVKEEVWSRPGIVSSSYDENVAAAVVKLQAKYGIIQTGYFGPLTRAKINSIYGCLNSSQSSSQSSNSSNSSNTSIVCPAGYICKPVNQKPEPFVCPAGYICKLANTSDEDTNTSDSNNSQYSDLSTNPDISGNVTLIGANEDKAPKWGPSGYIHSPDWKWSINLTNSGSTTKYIKKLVLVHNVSGEGWATDASAKNPLGKFLYTLAITPSQSSNAEVYTQQTDTLLPLWKIAGNGGSLSFYAYGYPVNQSFTGGKLIVEFTDNTSATLTIPASSIKPGNIVSKESSITVLSPNGKEVYKTGSAVDIKWDSKNISSDSIKISLYYKHNDRTYGAGQYFEDWIVEKTANTGSYRWFIPDYYSNGVSPSSFSIKVSSGDSITDYSDSTFTIMPGTGNTNIKISNPSKGDYYTKGQIVKIKWSPVPKESYSISLLRKNDPGFLKLSLNTLLNSSNNPYTLSWTIPSDIPDANDYYLRINHGPYRSTTGYSDVFSIGSDYTTTQPYITTVAGKAAGNFEIDAGGSVGITGINLLGTADTTYSTSVYINGIICPITQASNTLIYCTAPSSLQVGKTYNLYINTMLPGGDKASSNIVQVKVLSNVSTQNKATIKIRPSDYVNGIYGSTVSSGAIVPVFAITVSSDTPTSINGITIWSDTPRISSLMSDFRLNDGMTSGPTNIIANDLRGPVTAPNGNTQYYFDFNSTIYPNQPKTFVVYAHIANTASGSFRFGIGGLSHDVSSSIANGVGTWGAFKTIKSSFKPFITLISPNGGEKITIGNSTRIQTSGGPYVGNISFALWSGDSTLLNRKFIGWLGNSPVSYLDWDGKTICNGFNGTSGVGCSNVVPGSYKIYVVAFTGSENDTIEDISERSFTVVSPAVTGTFSITPSAKTVVSGQSVTLSYSVPSNTQSAKLYVSCPSIVSMKTEKEPTEYCNIWKTFSEVPSVLTWNTPFILTNTTSQSLNIVPNFYIYTAENPNYAQGISSEITVNPVSTAADR